MQKGFIYIIKNYINDKVYVGQTKQLLELIENIVLEYGN